MQRVLNFGVNPSIEESVKEVYMLSLRILVRLLVSSVREGSKYANYENIGMSAKAV